MFSKIEEIPVVTAADENYAPYLSVMIATLLIFPFQVRKS